MRGGRKRRAEEGEEEKEEGRRRGSIVIAAMGSLQYQSRILIGNRIWTQHNNPDPQRNTCEQVLTKQVNCLHGYRVAKRIPTARLSQVEPGLALLEVVVLMDQLQGNGKKEQRK